MEGPKRFYSQRAIAIATYFGGPLAAGYLVKKNYETLEQPDNASKSLIIGIISTILIFAGIFSVPDEIIDKIPNALIPLIYTGIIYLIVERIQGAALKNHKESGGEFYSGWKAAGVGAIAMVILILGFAVSTSIYFQRPQFDADIAVYENEMAKFTDNEARALAVFDVIETQTPQYLIREFSQGIVLWKENQEIIKGLNANEKISRELLAQYSLLSKYCDFRVQHNEVIIKAISEETDKYDHEIERIGSEISKILDELE
jgi:hypothetical protein